MTTPLLETLAQRLQRLAPEAVRGDEAAVAELRGVEDAIAAERRRIELLELAEIEEADRARIAAEAEAERLREEAANAKAGVEAERAREVAKADSLLRKLAVVLQNINALDVQIQVLGPKAEPGRAGYTFSRMLPLVESVLAWDMFQVGIRDLPFRSGPRPVLLEAAPPPSAGPDEATPAAASACSACVHGDAEAINAALDARNLTGEGLRAIGERFGVSKSTLSRHLAHRGG